MGIKKKNPFLAPRRRIGETLRTQKFGITGKRFGSPTSLGVFREPEEEQPEQPKMLDLSQPRKDTSNVITRYDRSKNFVEGRKYRNAAGEDFVWANGAFTPWAEWEKANMPSQTAANIAAPPSPPTPPSPPAAYMEGKKGEPGGGSGTGSIAADVSQPAKAPSRGKTGWDLNTAAPGLTDFLGSAAFRAGVGGLSAGLTYGTKAIGPGIVSGGASAFSLPSLAAMAINNFVPKAYAGIENKLAHSNIKDEVAANPDISFDDVMSRVDQAEEDYAMHSRPLAGQALEAIGFDVPNNMFTEMLGISSTPDLDAWNAESIKGYDNYAEDLGLSPSQQAMAMNQATRTNRQGQVAGYGSFLGAPLDASTLKDAYTTTPTSQLHEAFTNPDNAYKSNVNATNQAQKDASALAAAHSGFSGIDSTYSKSFSEALNQMGFNPNKAESFARNAVNDEVARQTQARHAAAMAAAGSSAGGTGSSGNAISGGVDRSSTAGNAATHAGAGTGPGGASENNRGNQFAMFGKVRVPVSSSGGSSSSGRSSPGSGWNAVGLGDWANNTFGTFTPNANRGGSWGAAGNMNSGNRNGTDSDGNPNSGDDGSIICTELYNQGLLPKRIWVADMRYAKDRTSDITKRGYHFWARPCVRAMQKSKFWTKFWKPIAGGWAYHMAYKLGRHPKPDWMGRIVGMTLLPFSHVVGRMLEVGDWLKGYNPFTSPEKTP